MICPLCKGASSLYSKDNRRDFYECQTCTLVFVSRDVIMTPEAELARYNTHQNSEEDDGYRQYLTQVLEEMKPFIASGEKGLDFGSGRTDVLAKLMTAAGVPSETYDLYYFPREEIWNKNFDVIVMSEVIEHLRDLMPVMERLAGLLKPGGRFFIKTKFLPEDKESFDRWYYKNDPTHVEFFNRKSMHKLAKLLRLEEPVFLHHDVTMVRAFR